MDVSIIIPIKNEIQTIGPCLTQIRAQQGTYSWEIMAIDSGSTDGSLEFLMNQGDVRLISIPPQEFGHGKTRNLGVQHARGKFIVFLNADAVPYAPDWLEHLLQGFSKDPQIAAVFSKHLPAPDCQMYMRRDLETSMPHTEQLKTFVSFYDYLLFSTVSAAIKKDIISAFPFDNTIAIAEDDRWAKKILNKGYKILYTPHSRVVHSHNYSFRQLYRLKAQVARNTCRFHSRFTAVTLGLLLCSGGFIYKFTGDICYILKQPIPLKQKWQELFSSFFARLATFSGKYTGWIWRKSPHRI
jgi:rhamnosyltransferase